MKPVSEAQLYTPYTIALALLASALLFLSVDPTWMNAFAVLSGVWAGATFAFAYGYNTGYGDGRTTRSTEYQMGYESARPVGRVDAESPVLCDTHDHGLGFSAADWAAQDDAVQVGVGGHGYANTRTDRGVVGSGSSD